MVVSDVMMIESVVKELLINSAMNIVGLSSRLIPLEQMSIDANSPRDVIITA